MCLITVGKATNIRSCLLGTVGLVEDIFSNNSDGFGVMFAGDKGGIVHKTLPKTADEASAWLDLVLPKDDREVAVHARYATHGVINLADDGDDNTHPYAVDGGYLMHNGILQLDTKSNKDRSDTWHFCRSYLEGTAHTLFATEGGRMLLGDHIGNNRFVFLGKDGRMYIVNEDQGIHGADLWFSNTYAWDPSYVIKSYRKPVAKTWGRFLSSVPASKGKVWDSTDFYGSEEYKGLVEIEDDDPAAYPLWTEEDDEQLAAEEYEEMATHIETGLEHLDEETLGFAVEWAPVEAIDYILYAYEIKEWAHYKPEDYPAAMQAAVAAWVKRDLDTLCECSTEEIVQSLLYCCEWTERETPRHIVETEAPPVAVPQ